MSTHPVETLFEELKKVEPYPHGVVPVTDRFEGFTFFPGGTGLYGTSPSNPFPSMPVGGVMVVGHNLFSQRKYDEMLLTLRAKGLLETQSTSWRNLGSLLDSAGVPKDKCFFTNAYMGLIDADSSIGEFPTTPEFTQKCVDFFKVQLQVMQPRLILSLGRHVAPFLSVVFEELEGRWVNKKNNFLTFNKIDTSKNAYIDEIRVQGLEHKVAMLALRHPSFQVAKRTFEDKVNRAAEIALLQHAWQRVLSN
jgi:uracil-DNA glycosylase